MKMTDIKTALETTPRIERIDEYDGAFDLHTAYNEFWLGPAKRLHLPTKAQHNPWVLLDAQNCLGRFIGDQSMENFDVFSEMQLADEVGAHLSADVNKPMFDYSYTNGLVGHGQGTLLTVVKKAQDLSATIVMFDNFVLGLKTAIMERSGQDPYNLPMDRLLAPHGYLFPKKA